jgi:hypothetical protein
LPEARRSRLSTVALAKVDGEAGLPTESLPCHIRFIMFVDGGQNLSALPPELAHPTWLGCHEHS